TRNYSFVRRRRPLSRPNEISSDSVEADELSRKIRSTTPDSREINGVRTVETSQFRRNRIRVTPQTEDSEPAAASPVTRGSFRPQLTRDEIASSLTPIVNEEIVEAPRFVPKENAASRTERRFRGRTSTTAADKVEDSEVSAATVEVRRPNILPRGRSRFTISTQAPANEPSKVTETAPVQRRPTFTRFQPRPFTRSSTTSTTSDDNLDDNEPVATTRAPIRLPFGRSRPSSTSSPLIQPRKLPFPSRQSTTVQTLTNEEEVEDDVEEKNDDISLSESAIEEKEHEEDNEEVQDIPKRRVVIKKIRPSTTAPEDVISTETIPIQLEESGKKKFRVIRRRPSSTSTPEAPEPSFPSTEASTPAVPKIRRIIRKKIKPVEEEPSIIAKSVGSLNTEAKVSSTTEQVSNYGEKTRTTLLPSSSEAPTTIATDEAELVKFKDTFEVQKEVVKESENDDKDEILEPSDKNANKEEKSELVTENEVKPTESEVVPTEVTAQNDETESKPEVVIEGEQKTLDLSENQENEASALTVTEAKESQPETTTVSTTQATSAPTRARLPYRPPKRLFTSTTESSVPLSSRVFSRKYNPGVYTSPASADKPDSFRPAVTRRPLFTSKFTRRPFTTARTTKKIEEEEYSDEEILDEEPENPFVFVPQNQLFTRKPDVQNEQDVEEDYDVESEEEPEDEPLEEEEPPSKFVPTTKRPGFKPRVVNSNTFRAASTTTELPKRQFGANRTAIFNRFGGNKPVNDTKKRVQNVPLGYNVPVGASPKPSIGSQKTETSTTTQNKDDDVQSTTTDSEFMTNADDDDYLSMTESTSTLSDTTNTSEDATATNTIEDNETTTEMEISTDDYLEYTEGTTNYPSTQDSTSAQTETENNTPFDIKTEQNTEITTESLPETTSSAPQVSPIVKTQFDKLFSVSRVVEVSSKLDKHRLNKNNETTLIEEGKIMVEKKPMVDKIGEVSRFSLIKIVEDEIPLYLTKLGHVYPVENPPENLIVIDEARNARALTNFADAPRENLVASESINEAYRHIKNTNKKDDESKDHVEHLLSDDFLSYINDDKKADKSTEVPDSYTPEWQFVPAAYENEKVTQKKTTKTLELVTPRSVQTKPSTLPLEALFKTETPLMARKIGDAKENQPFLVYSASVPTQNEDANIVKLEVIKPEAGRSIVTFAKGQEFQGAPMVEEATIKYPVNISVIPLTSEVTTETTATATLSTDSVTMGPVMDLLTTTQATTITTEAQTTTTDIPSTTETIPDETTTQKISPVDAKRSKFAFPRRPIIKSSNFTRPAPKALKKLNATVVSNSNQKANKTTGFSPNKSRFTAPRAQNVPIDVRKKATTKVAKTFTTEAPRTTTERKLYVKPIRPAFRPAFVPRKLSTAAPQTNGET
ncbi:uncharacterized protein LOC135075328, partial [Ostrinia nubilalis]|uniref:uncharacterized protein LOC135075328 n=1 Tax=Ostrinia nubilalis TaxID=29057 RepID=UPI00308225D6